MPVSIFYDDSKVCTSKCIFTLSNNQSKLQTTTVLLNRDMIKYSNKTQARLKFFHLFKVFVYSFTY